MTRSDLCVLCFVVVALAMVFIRSWRRLRRAASESEWEGHGIEVERVIAKIQALRLDYLSEVQGRRCSSHRKRAMMAYTRQAIGGFKFFRVRRRHEQSFGGFGTTAINRVM